MSFFNYHPSLTPRNRGGAWNPKNATGTVLFCDPDGLPASGDIGTWTSDTGGVNLVQANAAKKPSVDTTNTSPGGERGMFCDGVDEALYTDGNIDMERDFVAIIVGKLHTSGSGWLLIEQTANAEANSGFYFYGTSGDSAIIDRGALKRNVNAAANWSNGNEYVGFLHYSSSTPGFTLEKGITPNLPTDIIAAEGANQPLAGTTTDAIYVGSRNDASVYYKGWLWGLQVISNPDTSQLSDVKQAWVNRLATGAW